MICLHKASLSDSEGISRILALVLHKEYMGRNPELGAREHGASL